MNGAQRLEKVKTNWAGAVVRRKTEIKGWKERKGEVERIIRVE